MTEENQYSFQCGVCQKMAIGHKGRVVCDDCKAEAEDDAENDQIERMEDEDDDHDWASPPDMGAQ